MSEMGLFVFFYLTGYFGFGSSELIRISGRNRPEKEDHAILDNIVF